MTTKTYDKDPLGILQGEKRNDPLGILTPEVKKKEEASQSNVGASPSLTGTESTAQSLLPSTSAQPEIKPIGKFDFRTSFPSVTKNDVSDKDRYAAIENADAGSLANHYDESLGAQFDFMDFGKRKADFSQSREGKAGKIIKDFESGKANASDLDYLRKVAPTAAKEVMRTVLPNVPEEALFSGEAIDAAVRESSRINIQKAKDLKVENSKRFDSFLADRLASFEDVKIDPTKVSDSQYAENIIKEIEAKQKQEMAALNNEFPQTAKASGGTGGAAVYFTRDNEAEYQKRVSALQQKYGGIREMVGLKAVNDAAKKDPTDDPRNLGENWAKIARPDEYKLWIAANKASSGLSKDMAQVGINALYGSDNPGAVELAFGDESGLDDRYPVAKAAEIRHKLGVELNKSNNWFLNAAPSIQELDEAAKQLTQSDRDFYYKHVRGEESRYFGSQIPQRGVLNEVGIGAGQTLEGITNYLNLKVGLRTSEDVARDALNSVFDTKYQSVGEFGPAVQKLNYLNNKEKNGEKLTPDEIKERNDLQGYTNVRSGFDKFIDVSFNLGGQVLIQALLTRGIGGLAAKGVGAVGLLKAAGAAEGLVGLDAVAANAVNFGIADAATIEKIVGGAVAYASSYDQAAQDAVRLMPGKEDATKRSIFANTVGILNAVTENIFRDSKVFDAFNNEIAPNVKVLVDKLVAGEISKEALAPAFTKLLKQSATFVEHGTIENTKEAFEEFATAAGQSAAVGILAPAKFNFNNEFSNAVGTFTSMFSNGAIIGGIAGVNGARAANIGARTLASIGVNQQLTNSAHSYIDGQVANGAMTQEEANGKKKILNIATAINTRTMPEVNRIGSLSEKASAKYAVQVLNEKVLAEKIAQGVDPELQETYEQQIDDSRKIRKQIMNKEVVVGNDFSIQKPPAPYVEPVADPNERFKPKPSAEGTASTATGTTVAAPETKPEPPLQHEDTVSINEMIGKPVTRNGERGMLTLDGQTVLFKPEGVNREYELGNSTEIFDQSIKNFGLEQENSVVDVNDAGDVTVRGVAYKNNYSDPTQAINRDKDGNIVSVTLSTDDNKNRTFRGNVAEDVAYQIQLKEINKNNETRQAFEQFVEADESAAQQIVDAENAATAEVQTTTDNAEVQRVTITPIEPTTTATPAAAETTPATDNTTAEPKSILTSEEDLKGDTKELWMMKYEPDKADNGRVVTPAVGEKGDLGAIVNVGALQKNMIGDAVDEGRYEKAIKEGRMTASDAKTIIESADLEVPQDILIDAGVEAANQKKSENQVTEEKQKTEKKTKQAAKLKSSKRVAKKVAPKPPVQQQAAEGQSLQINAENAAVFNTDDADTSLKSKLVEDAKKVVTALKTIAPDLKVVIHDTDESFKEATGVAGRGAFDRATNTIHVNVNKVDEGTKKSKSGKTNTVLHEGTHPILNIIAESNPEAVNNLYDQLQSLSEEVDGVKNVLAFGERYKDQGDGVAKMEAIVEFISQVANGDIDLSGVRKNQSLFQRVADIVKGFIGMISGKTPNLDANDVVKLAKQISKAFRGDVNLTRENVSGIKNLDDPKILHGDTLTSGVIPDNFKTGGKISIQQQLEAPEDKRVQLGRDWLPKEIKTGSLSAIKGKYFTTTMSDRGATGKMKYKNSKAYEKQGGIFYPMLMKHLGLNRVWAASQRHKMQRLLEQLKPDENGYAYVGVMAMGTESHMSNVDSMNFAFDVIANEMVSGKPGQKPSKRQLISAINQAYQVKDKRGLKLADTVEVPKLTESMTVAQINSAVTNSFGNDAAAFHKRTSFLESLLGSAKENKRLPGIPNYESMAKLTAEPALNEAKNGDVVAYMKVKPDDLSIVETKPGDKGHHYSYPFAIESSSPVDYVLLDEAVHVSEVYPKFINASGNVISFKQAKKDYGVAMAERTHTRNVMMTSPTEKVQLQREAELTHEEIRDRYLDDLNIVSDSAFDWRVTSALSTVDRQKAVQDIRNGKSTAATKKLEQEIGEANERGTVIINRGRGNQAQSVEIPINEWFRLSTEEQAQVFDDAEKIDDDAVRIINESDITSKNIDDLKHLFNGFPYEQSDFTAVKGYLARQGESGNQTTQAGQSRKEAVTQLQREAQDRVERKVGITNALTTEQVENLKDSISPAKYKQLKDIADKLNEAGRLESEQQFEKANKLYDQILDYAEKRLSDLFSDIDEVSVKINRTKGSFFAATEPTFEYTITDKGDNINEIAKRLADVANNEFKQDSVHISELMPTLPDGVTFGVQQPDMSVYEPNINITLDREMTEKEMAEIEGIIQDAGLAGSTRFSDKKGLFLYNISNFKDYGDFIDETKQAFDWLHGKGFQFQVEQNVRKLWNIGRTEGEGFVSYEQAKNISSTVPQTAVVQEQKGVEEDFGISDEEYNDSLDRIANDILNDTPVVDAINKEVRAIRKKQTSGFDEARYTAHIINLLSGDEDAYDSTNNYSGLTPAEAIEYDQAISSDNRSALSDRIASISPQITGERSEFSAAETFSKAGYTSRGRREKGETTTVDYIVQANLDFIDQLNEETGGNAIPLLMEHLGFSKNRGKNAKGIDLKGLSNPNNFNLINVLFSYLKNNGLSETNVSPAQANEYAKYLKKASFAVGRNLGQALNTAKLRKVTQTVMHENVISKFLSDADNAVVSQADQALENIIDGGVDISDEALLASEPLQTEAEIESQARQSAQLERAMQMEEMKTKLREVRPEKSKSIADRIKIVDQKIKDIINSINCD